jgi:hypothetical protein
MLLFWFSLQGVCEGPKIILLFSITWVSHIERTLEVNGLFWFSLEGGCRGSKKVLFFSLAHSWPHGQNTRARDKLLFWFSLQSGCEGLKMFYAFHLYGCSTICTEN